MPTLLLTSSTDHGAAVKDAIQATFDADAADGPLVVEVFCRDLAEVGIVERLASGDRAVVQELYASVETLDDDIKHHSGANTSVIKDFADLLEDIAGEVSDLVRTGLFAEAARRLHLVLHPKWDSLAECDAAYGVATGRVYGPPDLRTAIDRFHAQLVDLPMFAALPSISQVSTDPCA